MNLMTVFRTNQMFIFYIFSWIKTPIVNDTNINTMYDFNAMIKHLLMMKLRIGFNYGLCNEQIELERDYKSTIYHQLFK